MMPNHHAGRSPGDRPEIVFRLCISRLGAPGPVHGGGRVYLVSTFSISAPSTMVAPTFSSKKQMRSLIRGHSSMGSA